MTPLLHDKRKNAPSPLHTLFDFTDEDLAENAQGRLSERQQQRLRRNEIGQLVFACGFAVILALIMIGLSFMFLTREEGPDLVVWVLSLCLLVPLALASIAAGWVRWQNVQADLVTLDERVDIFTGPIDLSVERYGRGSIRYKLLVQDQIFEVPKQALGIFRQEAHYHVYVAKATHTILSAQFVTHDKAKITYDD